ncbi:MAG: hypothetical protein GXO94_00810 [Nitrospirae bacterium]|nr:hypothetical protein [Nitrospirota bacterium]
MKGMTYSEAVKQGFRVVNRNWQLVLVRIALAVLSCAGFLFIVVIPLVIAMFLLGISPVFLSKLESSPDIILTQYFGVAVIAGLLLLLYILAAASLGLYVYAASAGVIARTVKDEARGFSMRAFFEEGRRLFFPVLWFATIIGLIAIGVVVCFAVAGVLVSAVITYAKSQSLSLSMFLGVFFSLIGVVSGALILFGLMALTVYGMAAITLKGSRPAEALTETARYLWRTPSAFYLYAIMASLYVVLSLVLALVGLPLKAVPFIGLILSLPYQLLIYAVQGYAGLFILSVAFVYYHRTADPASGRGTEYPEVKVAGE